MSKLFSVLSREEQEAILEEGGVETPVESTVDAVVAQDVQADVAEDLAKVDEMHEAAEDAEEVLDDLQNAENTAAAAAGEEPTSVDGGPVEDVVVEGEEPDEGTRVKVEVPADAPAPEVAVTVAQEALKYASKRLQMGLDKKSLLSYESINTNPAVSLRISREALADVAASVVEGLKRMWAKIKSVLASLWDKIVTLFLDVNKKIDSLAKSLSEADAAKIAAVEFKPEEALAIAKSVGALVFTSAKDFKSLLAAKADYVKKLDAQVAMVVNATSAAAKAVAAVKEGEALDVDKLVKAVDEIHLDKVIGDTVDSNGNIKFVKSLTNPVIASISPMYKVTTAPAELPANVAELEVVKCFRGAGEGGKPYDKAVLVNTLADLKKQVAGVKSFRQAAVKSLAEQDKAIADLAKAKGDSKPAAKLVSNASYAISALQQAEIAVNVQFSNGILSLVSKVLKKAGAPVKEDAKA